MNEPSRSVVPAAAPIAVRQRNLAASLAARAQRHRGLLLALMALVVLTGLLAGCGPDRAGHVHQ